MTSLPCGILLARLLLRSARCDGGKGDSARVYRCAVQQVVARRLLVGVGGHRVGDIHLPGASRRKACVLFHEHHHDAIDFRGIAVVVGIGLQDNLLSVVPLLQHVAAAADRVGAVITTVSAIGNDADNG